MTFNDYQRDARKTAQYPVIGHGITYPALGITGEAGEISDKVKKIFRDKGGVISDQDREALVKECGDVLWYLSALADELGTSLEAIAITNIEKLSSRQQRGMIGGEGDNR